MRPVEIHEALDTKGLLEASHGPGAYALRVDTPACVEGVARAFLSVGDATPPDDTLQRLTSENVAYVGGSQNVYDRLQEHSTGNARRALFLEVFDIVDVVNVWPSDNPFREEYSRAQSLSNSGWCVWYDGEVF